MATDASTWESVYRAENQINGLLVLVWFDRDTSVPSSLCWKWMSLLPASWDKLLLWLHILRVIEALRVSPNALRRPVWEEYFYLAGSNGLSGMNRWWCVSRRQNAPPWQWASVRPLSIHWHIYCSSQMQRVARVVYDVEHVVMAPWVRMIRSELEPQDFPFISLLWNIV